MITTISHKILNQFEELLFNLENFQYTKKLSIIQNSSIGEHIRHCIELFICLEKGYHCDTINYDLRERNLLLQTDKNFAIKTIQDLYKKLQLPDKILFLEQSFFTTSHRFETNFYRELAYNIEHCIHHQAILKIALIQENIAIPTNFGIASSTLEYKSKCVQ